MSDEATFERYVPASPRPNGGRFEVVLFDTIARRMKPTGYFRDCPTTAADNAVKVAGCFNRTEARLRKGLSNGSV
jgi:hypothetical protein